MRDVHHACCRCAARGFLSLSWITISLLARSVIAGISGDMENDSPSRAMMDGAYLVYGRPFIFIGTVDFPTSFVFPFLAYMSRSHTFHLGETSKSILALQKMRFPTDPHPFASRTRQELFLRSDFFSSDCKKIVCKIWMGKVREKYLKQKLFH